jgi:hypothetical protein
LRGWSCNSSHAGSLGRRSNCFSSYALTTIGPAVGNSMLLPMLILTLTRGIPLWFLVLSLFLPRLSLFIGWIHMWWFFVPQPWAAVLWALLPRVLVLIFIHAHQGFDLWFWIHLVTALVVWSGSGATHNNRRIRRRNI